MSIQIIILGLLETNSYHPYEIKKIILENNWDKLIPVTDGNLYHAIRKLKKENCIIEVKQELIVQAEPYIKLLLKGKNNCQIKYMKFFTNGSWSLNPSIQH
ncbi:PadR family transcriptional regulator [Bacillus aquiflavi]|uniref:PadR family transcriptional regulator n=1 Tax=Bacillus aquiflavi TaxID=2672567 RepID=UPI001FEC5EE5|nr:helix-turn-helix transcriptional regulator [Bacillus aquiflavi]